ncbi:MAG: hypothetical protein KAQ98_14400 [Bacteriovoracaceae bacterium]|nr:hypothetical protein [Bacteriovoracaceae bacterium]
MKVFIIFILTTVSLSCFSITSKKFKNKYEKISRDLSDKISLCQKQNKNTVKKPIKEFENAIRKEEYVAFIEDEKKALFYIDNFDFSKLTTQQEYKYFKLILENCSKDNLEIYAKLEKNRQSCSPIFDELNFMRGLIYATKNFKWSTKTVEKVKSKILRYIKFQATLDTTPIIHSLISLTLLKEMVEYGLISNKYKKEIVSARDKGEQRAEDLKKQLKKEKIDLNKYNCSDLNRFHNRELKISKKTVREIRALLAKITK